MKVKFVYSWIYDGYLFYSKKRKPRSEAYFSKMMADGKTFASKMQKLYNRNKRVFDIMSSVSGLKWKEKEVKVYVVHNLDWDFSEPVTILIRKNMADAFETFAHEMSHQLVRFQNENKLRLNNKFEKKYEKEHMAIKHHILEHAILWKTYLKFYGAKRTREIIKEYHDEGWKWHYKAWEIALKEGPDKVIKAYIK
jgi:hypothetical protein